MNENVVVENLQAPTVFFIDDSATMRGVMKIAFRRENIGVVACHDANDALLQIEESMPDVVITDVIMPEKDGFEVCEFIKQHPKLSKTPVVLLSGVVNREVADKAFNVKADELIRKPFQPQDLIARVKQLLAPKNPAPVVPTPAATPHSVPGPATVQPAAVALAPKFVVSPAAASQGRNLANDMAKLRLEVGRLENLVKKLQSELTAEREYSRALEAHVKTLQEDD